MKCTKHCKYHKQPGFTIVELLVSIVIIVILVAISTVAYINVSGRAAAASMQSDLAHAKTQLKMFQTENSNFPIANNCSTPNSTEICLKLSSGNTFVGYSANNQTSPQTFQLIISRGSQFYKITNSTAPTQLASTMQPGVTPGATTELHAAKANGGSGPGINSPMTAIWDDTSGNSKDAWLSNLSGSPWIGTGTAVNPYALAFTGGDDYVYNTDTPINKSSFTIEVWSRQTVRSPAYTRWLLSYGLGGLSDWNGDGRMYALLWGTGGPGYALVATSQDLADGALHHIVMTVSATELAFYVDGGLVGTSSLVGFIPIDPGTTVGLASNGWVGNISVARIYGWPLSATQVSANYAAGADW